MPMCASQSTSVDKLSSYNILFPFSGHVTSCAVHHVISVWLSLMIMNGKKIVTIYSSETIFQTLKSLKAS